jgi:hypothetical protein
MRATDSPPTIMRRRADARYGFAADHAPQGG